jgi:predicted DNA binding CopG/RHH family protein
MTIEELQKDLEAHGHRVVPDHLSEEELEEVERELDETVGIDDERMAELAARAKAALSGGRKKLRMVSLRLDDETIDKMKAKAAELGMPYQAVARKVLKAAFA